MAHPTTSHHTAPARSSFRDWVAGFGAGLSQRAEMALNRLSRADRVAAYNARSDAELARMGLTRDGIVAYVFRDKFYM